MSILSSSKSLFLNWQRRTDLPLYHHLLCSVWDVFLAKITKFFFSHRFPRLAPLLHIPGPLCSTTGWCTYFTITVHDADDITKVFCENNNKFIFSSLQKTYAVDRQLFWLPDVRVGLREVTWWRMFVWCYGLRNFAIIVSPTNYATCFSTEIIPMINFISTKLTMQITSMDLFPWK